MNKIILDGKEYELSDELAEKIKAEVTERERQDKENLFERKQGGGDYYYISSSGKVLVGGDTAINFSGRYKVANYCRDKELMEQRALHETLTRLLWRYSETHGGDETWYKNRKHYFVALKYPYRELFVDWTFTCKYELEPSKEEI